PWKGGPFLGAGLGEHVVEVVDLDGLRARRWPRLARRPRKRAIDLSARRSERAAGVAHPGDLLLTLLDRTLRTRVDRDLALLALLVGLGDEHLQMDRVRSQDERGLQRQLLDGLTYH